MKLNIKKIEAYLESKKVSNKAFAEMIGMTAIGWSQMKRRGSTTGESWLKIADVMGVDPNTLLSNYKETGVVVTMKGQTTEVETTISDRVREFAMNNLVSLREFSELIHVPYRTLTHQLSNNIVSAHTLYSISRIFEDVDMNYFFGRKCPQESHESVLMASEPQANYGAKIKIDDLMRRIEALENKKADKQ